jgi:ABC-2 type transport system permease protein
MNWRRSIRGAYAIWLRDVLALVQDRARLIGTFVGNVVMLVALGFGLGGAIGNIGGTTSAVGVPYIQFLFPTMLCLTGVMSAVQSTMSVVWDREFGLMRKVLVAPLSRTSVALGKVGGGVTVAVIQGLILMLAIPLLSIPVGFVQVLAIVTLLILVSAVVTALGILVAARQTSMQGFQVISLFVILPLMILTFGTALPMSEGPEGRVLRVLSEINPVGYGVDAVRQIVLSGRLAASLTLHPPAVDAAILVVFFVVFLVPGVLLFRKQD